MIYDTYRRERIIVNKYLHSSLSNTFYLSACTPLHDRIIIFFSVASWAETQEASVVGTTLPLSLLLQRLLQTLQILA